MLRRTRPARSTRLRDATVYEAAFLRRPSKDWLEDFWANDVPVQPAVPLGEIFEDEQARANDYVIDLDDPERGTHHRARPAAHDHPPTRVQSAAPELGAHTDEVLAEWKPQERDDGRDGRGADRSAGRSRA